MDALKEQIRSEMALANYQDLLQRINNRCFTRCITKPGASLSSSEEVCSGCPYVNNELGASK
jgi:import inner membrane translocase subunit TIM13